MAEAVAAVAGKIVASLVPQAMEYAGKLWDFKDEVKALGDTISTLQAVLEQAEEQYHLSPQIQDYVSKLKKEFYRAEDLLEGINIEGMRREMRGQSETMKVVWTTFTSPNYLVFQIKMILKLKEVRKRIQAITDDKKLHLVGGPVRQRRKTDETSSFVPEEDVIGREEDKKAVMKFLLDSHVQENISILPIVGIGGLGKTALAHYVYKNEKKSGRFDLKMWVSVSEDFDLKKVVKKMIVSAKKEEPIGDGMEPLQNLLRSEIDGKKYLLVLDDVWIEKRKTWSELESLLKGGARGSKILITTRLPLTAEIVGTTLPLFLKDLSEIASLKLLMQAAVCTEDQIKDPDMQDIGREIVRKCSGVPLAIRAVGSSLFNASEEDWLRFKDSKLPDVSEGRDDILPVLKLSYNCLPPYLKPCFAFCSLFPKNSIMEKQNLVNLWMAAGFIDESSDRTRDLEDIAHGYFMDLLRRNFFQNFRKDPITNEETCKMHDLMHDLAISVAKPEYWECTEPLHERTLHVSYGSISNFLGELQKSQLKASRLRTFLSIAEYVGTPKESGEEHQRQLYQSFKRLRILDLQALRVERVSMSICKLKYLTYLDLSDNSSLERLPDSITELQKLQTLILNGCRGLQELPRDMRKLVSLRHLDIANCTRLNFMPRGLGELISLRRLTRFILPKDGALAKDSCGLGELKELNNIRDKLCIENLGHVEDPTAESGAANLGGKKSLKSLELVWTDRDGDDAKIGDRDEALLNGLRPDSKLTLQNLMIRGYAGERFPEWMMQDLAHLCPKLVDVRLHGCRRCKHLPPLGQLPHLKNLEIVRLTQLESIELSHPTTSFPSLLKLKILDCGKLKGVPRTPHLEELTLRGANKQVMYLGLSKLKRLYVEYTNVEGGLLLEKCFKSLTSLESLDIYNCGWLTSLSRGMRHLSNLVHLSIDDCSGLDIWKDESGNILDFHPLPPLLSLRISYLLKLESLPPWLVQLTTLEHLQVEGCLNLKELPEQIKNFQSLQRLEINCCDSLTSLPKGMLRLVSLTHLTILSCENLDLCKDQSGNLFFTKKKKKNGNLLDSHALPPLRFIYIGCLPKLEFLPQWLLQLSSLEHLKIADCSNLMELPEQIDALQSLRELYIENCPLLTSLPEGIPRLISLIRLTIYQCPNLKARYDKDTGGEDWRKIAHIPQKYF